MSRNFYASSVVSAPFIRSMLALRGATPICATAVAGLLLASTAFAADGSGGSSRTTGARSTAKPGSNVEATIQTNVSTLPAKQPALRKEEINSVLPLFLTSERSRRFAGELEPSVRSLWPAAGWW